MYADTAITSLVARTGTGSRLTTTGAYSFQSDPAVGWFTTFPASRLRNDDRHGQQVWQLGSRGILLLNCSVKLFCFFSISLSFHRELSDDFPRDDCDLCGQPCSQRSQDPVWSVEATRMAPNSAVGGLVDILPWRPFLPNHGHQTAYFPPLVDSGMIDWAGQHKSVSALAPRTSQLLASLYSHRISNDVW